ncbi:MAG TPA: peptidoglycan-associated lipoprotein Pal [Methylophilaceae bacterium]|jgi:peptidoglycan-associated lipoprotein
MNKKFAISIIMTMFLAACASKPIEEPKAPATDNSPPATVPTPAAPATDSSNSSSTMAADASTAPKGELSPLKDPNNILSSRSVYFDYDKDEVKSEYRALVEAHAKYLVAHPNAKLVLQGNADDRGSREYNLALGQRRSVAVRKVMNVLGASDTQIETISYGKEKPRCSEQTDDCRAKNRRVDIVYDGE